MYSNTTSIYPTHFLRGVELVVDATEKYNIPSENWPHPTDHRYGIPVDDYYAELWVNGMDWQPTYWVIEEAQLNPPRIYPFIIFESNEEQSKFNSYDFTMLVKASLYYRRDLLFVKHNELGVFSDLTWPYIKCIDDEQQFACTQKFEFAHASQEPIQFWMNIDFLPDYIVPIDDSDMIEENSNVVEFHVPDSLRPRPVS